MRIVQDSVGFTAWHNRVLAGMLLCIAASDAAWGQCEPVWTQRVDVPQHRRDAVMVFDSWREVTLMIGGFIASNEPAVRYLWQWDGIKWTRLDEIGPTERLDLAELAFDSARGVTVLHTQVRNRPSQTWEFDGDSWALVGGGPPAGGERTMTYDAARGVTLLWGENGIGTWSWDGAEWTFLEPGPQPAFARMHMVYDSVREVVVMYGDFEGVSETWEWAGQGWTQVAVGVPPRRFGHALGFDSERGVTVLHGGSHGAGKFDDTWTWDGVSWTQVAVSNPSARARHAMAYDSVRGEMLLFGGWGGGLARPLLNDTWGWDGQTWRLRDEGEPLARSWHSMEYDTKRGVAVMFGGYRAFMFMNDTWQHDGSRWRLIGNQGPAPRMMPATAFNSRNCTILLHGGQMSGGELGDTWLWDGTSWSFLTDEGPEARKEAAMAYDSIRDVTVLFAGALDIPNDTWEFDGATWTFRGLGGPSSRGGHSMVFDERLGVVVLFGGRDVDLPEITYYQDTWHWDGTTWSFMAEDGPEARRWASMAYDSDRQVTLLFGGEDANTDSLDDMWQWDGVVWTPVATSTPPQRRAGAMVYARDRATILLHGGDDDFDWLADTWEFRTDSPSSGDVNCDCAVDALDIEPFIVALFDPTSYAKRYPFCDLILADINADGTVNALDIEPFIDLLFEP